MGTALASGPAGIQRLEDALAANPGSPQALTDLGIASLTRFRETADPSWLARARAVLSQAEEIDPEDPRTLTGSGLVSLALHDFEEALLIGRRAAAANPDGAEPLGVVVDALVELGRYSEAVEAAEEMVDLKPGVAAYSRVSYLRELHGDQPGAVESMTQALTAATVPADLAYLSTLLGNLHLGDGDVDAARSAYEQALGFLDSYSPARTGLARVSAATADLPGARTLLEQSTLRLPIPESVALLGDVLASSGEPKAAGTQYELVRSIEELNRANGISVDLELAAFEATHARDPGGRPTEAVVMAKAALAGRPTIFASDTMGWALRQAGQPADALPHAQAAVKLGTRHAELWWHLAAIEADLGLRTEAAEHLTTSFSINPNLNPHDLPEARALAANLKVAIPAA